MSDATNELVVRFNKPGNGALESKNITSVTLNGSDILTKRLVMIIDVDRMTVMLEVLPGEIEFDGPCNVSIRTELDPSVVAATMEEAGGIEP